MKIKIIFFITLLFCVLLSSCFDLYAERYDIDGPYFVQLDAGAVYQTLYYDLGDGNAIGRVTNIKRVGHTNKFIIAEVENGFYIFEKSKDNKFLNENEIIGDLKTREYFLNFLDSLKIENFEFDYYLEK